MADAEPSTSAAPAATQQKAAEPAPGPSKPDLTEDELLKEFFSDLKDVDRDNEVNRILWAFKLNPFEKLNLRFDCTLDDVKKAFRKISLMVHPDKCKHEHASTAFEILGDAQKEILDEERRGPLLYVLGVARDEVRKERKKETKHDSAVRLKTVLAEEGREAVEAAWEQTDEFHERWKLKARDLLANTAWRKKKITKRIMDEKERARAEAKEAKEAAKAAQQADKDWEQTRDERVGSWRDFMKKSKKAKKMTGEFKPPKQKTNDEEKLYVQRPVGEQFRPAAGKPLPGGSKPAGK